MFLNFCKDQELDEKTIELMEKLRKGFQSSPKYFPEGFAYNEDGVKYLENYRCDCPAYYFQENEWDVLSNHAEIYDMYQHFPALVEIGDCQSILRKHLIDTAHKKTYILEYYPIRRTEEQANALCGELEGMYGKRIDPKPFVNDLETGIERIMYIKKSRMIIWFGGDFQELSYKRQIEMLGRIADVMKREDVLFVTVDVNTDQEEIHNAFLDPKGDIMNIFWNNIWRLNQEFGAKVKSEKFELETRFVEDSACESSSYVQAWIRSKTAQSFKLRKLGMNVKLAKDEKIFLHPPDSWSCRYTEAQMATLGQKAGLFMQDAWSNEKVALCCFKKRGELYQRDQFIPDVKQLF